MEDLLAIWSAQGTPVESGSSLPMPRLDLSMGYVDTGNGDPRPFMYQAYVIFTNELGDTEASLLTERYFAEESLTEEQALTAALATLRVIARQLSVAITGTPRQGNTTFTFATEG